MSIKPLLSSNISPHEIKQLKNEKIRSALRSTALSIMYFASQIILFYSCTIDPIGIFSIGVSLGPTICSAIIISTLGYFHIKEGVRALAEFANLIQYWCDKKVSCLKIQRPRIL